ncbi:hypothetical protein B0A55_03622 [Friedmanniomyces simplex]|uniref:Uncharacterized protein n=1 Tax=Friedmanniomyces simplex TaxID=329884 RepID=A0A4U0XP03_9PEZI|nr:hypothetical protein B0A55_03622 [Friedmanniomyces simplex]
MRRSVASAFTPNAVLDYEPWVDESIAELLDVHSKRPSIDPFSTMLYYSMDAAGRFSFGSSFGCMAANADVEASIQMIRNRFKHWGWWSSLPGLDRLVYTNSIAMRMKRAPSSMAATAIARLAASQVNPEVLDAARIVGMLVSTMSGAGDTTATSTTAILYFLLKNPDKFAKLRSELCSAGIDGAVPSNSQVAKLPYLHAVIREGMRLFPTVAWPIERKVPSGGALIAGTHFPEGTSMTLSDSQSVLEADFSPAVACLKPLKVDVVLKRELL